MAGAEEIVIGGLFSRAANFLGYSGGEASKPPVRYAHFTQDLLSLMVVTKSGYTLYSLKSDDSLQKLFTSDEDEELLLAERLRSTSLLAFVTSKDPKKLRLRNFRKGDDICFSSYDSEIRSVKFNKERLVVCLETCIHIHNINCMEKLDEISALPSNCAGLVALTDSTSSDGMSYIAYPFSSTVGEVQLFDAIGMRTHITISAHRSLLVALAFNSTATLLATASQQGTVIRVFGVEKGEKMFEFRRGVKRCADIYCLSFSLDSSYLCCSSNTATVHVFKLVPGANDRAKEEEEGQGWYGYLGQALKSSSSYLPTSMSEALTQDRDFSVARLPVSGVRNISALICIEKQYRILVATQDGVLYVYNLDVTLGGECTLVTQHRISEDGEVKSSNHSDNNATIKSNPPVVSAADVVAVGNKQPSSITASKETSKPVNTVDDRSTAINKNHELGNADSKSNERGGACAKSQTSYNTEDFVENGSAAGSKNEDSGNDAVVSDGGINSSSGNSDSCLQWVSQRKSYARAVQSASAGSVGGAPSEATEDWCSSCHELEEAIKFEDALSGDAYLPNDSQSAETLRIDDSAEFPSFNGLKRS